MIIATIIFFVQRKQSWSSFRKKVLLLQLQEFNYFFILSVISDVTAFN